MDPFIIVPKSALNFGWVWRDWGTGGNDWSFVTVANLPVNAGKLSDHGMYGYAEINVNVIGGPNVVFAPINRSDVCKPCDNYQLVRQVGGSGCSVWIPLCSDKNYMAVGHAIVRGHNAPPVGQYYLIHRRYLIDNGMSAPAFHDDDGLRLYGNLGEAYCNISIAYPQRYTLRSDNALLSCCTGSGLDCQTFTKGSYDCQLTMQEQCKPEDIMPGGKCFTRCQLDPVGCNQIKVQFCNDHPDNSFCDCLNATTRDDYKDQISEYPLVYNMSIPACFYPKCKLGDNKVFTTTDMVKAQEGDRCKADINYIDQQIRILGSQNVVNANQTAQTDKNKQLDSKLTGDNKDIAIKFILDNYLLILIFIIIIIISGVYEYKYTNYNKDIIINNV